MTEKTLWRIPKLPREEWTEEAIDSFSFWNEPNVREEGSKTNVMMVMACHATMANAWNVWGHHILVTNTTPLRDRELVILRVGYKLKSEYEWHNHVGYALNLGMSLEEIAAIKEGPGAPNWNEHDRAVLTGVDELLDNNDMTDATWAALGKDYSRQQMMDLVLMTGHYAMTAWAINAFRMPLEAHADQIGWDLKTKSGKTPTATLKPGEADDWADKRGYED